MRTASVICGVNTEHAMQKPYTNLWSIFYVILTFSLSWYPYCWRRGNQMVKMSKLDLLIGLVKHAAWTDSLYFPYLLLLFISKIQTLSQPNLQISSYVCWSNFNFLEYALWYCAWVHGATWLEVCLFLTQSQIVLKKHRAFLQGSLTFRVLMSDLLRLCLVLRIVVTLLSSLSSSFSETPFK
jgi:hypothetical protein